MAFLKTYVIGQLKPILSSFLRADSIDKDLISFESLGSITLHNVVGPPHPHQADPYFVHRCRSLFNHSMNT